MAPEDNPASTESLFRPAKKRKFTRRRPDETEDTDNQNDNLDAPQTSGHNNIRRPRTVRRGGIGFSTASRLGDDQGQQLALAPAADPNDEKIRAMNERFTGYSGGAVDVDKHMYGSILRPSFHFA